MRLKGKNLENISESDLLKKEQTLKKMTKVREAGENISRTIIKEKLDWSIKEREKGVEILQKLANQADGMQTQIKQLDGAIAALRNLLATPVESAATTEEKK